ncbi:lysyl oxidase family protein [Sorangium sp. So ce1153]|uniref:lysyl oxidase family protein n=1 Tax=Sorangium sp. So ce1153 TaxID=3133333 RepID=UPI003F63DEF1
MKQVIEALLVGSWLLAGAACGDDGPTEPPSGTGAGGSSGEGGSGGSDAGAGGAGGGTGGAGGDAGGVRCAGSDIVCPEGARCQIDTEGRPSGCTATCDEARACGDAACCSPGASCVGGECMAADLVLEPAERGEPVAFEAVSVAEDACEVQRGCVGGSGRRALMRFNVSLRNAGEVPLELGAPSESDVFEPNFCESSYVVPRLFRAVLRQGDAVAAEAELDARCVAMASGQYSCDAQGLGPGDHVEQPGTFACNALDVTGVPAGLYELEITVNPRKTLAEASFDNNTIVLPVDYPACDGTVCGGACCPTGHECRADVCMVPDLVPDEGRIVDTLRFSYQTFPADACEIMEGCIGGPGRRHLLQFEGRIDNAGPGHVDPGPEFDNPLFEYAQCHQHFHFLNFTDYRLVDAGGAVVTQGHKQAFCLVDMAPLDPVSPAPRGFPSSGGTGCNFLSAGWADVYEVGTACQWVDVTDVPEGDYVLRVAVNPAGAIAEQSLENNVVEVPVHVPAYTPCVPEPEICGDFIDQDCDEIPDNGCGGGGGCAFPMPELCGNDVDDDCNGVPDDGCAPIPGADSCETPGELTDSMSYAAEITADNAPEVDLSCGGEGGEVFFRFTLPSEEVVYLGTLESEIDTVLAVLEGDGCSGAAVGCAARSCGELTVGTNFAARLPAGTYTVVVKAVRPGASGRVRLAFQRTSCLGEAAEVIAGSGLVSGDTTGKPIPPRSACGPSSPEQTFYVPVCPGRAVVVSSCGLTSFPMTIETAADACDPTTAQCSSPFNACAGDPEGTNAAIIGTRTGGGLGAITVSGRTPVDFGPYQLFVTSL